MPACSDKTPPHDKVPPADMSVFVMPAPTKGAFNPTAMIERREIKGTVDAAIRPIEAHFYSVTGEPLIAASPYGAGAISKSLRQPKTPRAIDLISELQEISGQVNRMMAQVERAIDRLAVHGG